MRANGQQKKKWYENEKNNTDVYSLLRYYNIWHCFFWAPNEILARRRRLISHRNLFSHILLFSFFAGRSEYAFFDTIKWD